MNGHPSDAILQDIPWLLRLGQSAPSAMVLCRPTLRDWAKYIQSAAHEELFADETDEIATLEGMEWLGEDGPNPNRSLATAMQAGLPEELRRERLAVTRAVLRGLEVIPPSPWLVVGPHDLRSAVRKSAPHAFRMAAAEAHFGVPGFWSSVTDLYKTGLWPAAVLSDGTIVSP